MFPLFIHFYDLHAVFRDEPFWGLLTERQSWGRVGHQILQNNGGSLWTDLCDKQQTGNAKGKLLCNSSMCK